MVRFLLWWPTCESPFNGCISLMMNKGLYILFFLIVDVVRPDLVSEILMLGCIAFIT